MKRGSYARRACNHCRRRKSKCDGIGPTCSTCRLSGHECSWGPESAKRPISKQLVESLRGMNKILNQRIRFLETQLAQYTSRPVDGVVHSGSSLTLRTSDRGSPSSCGGPSSPASTQSEPVITKTEPQDVDIDHIIAPTQHLHLSEKNELELYGPTSIFRLAPRSPERRTFSDEMINGTTDVLSQMNPVLNAEIDWARHLPQEAPLTRVEHDQLLALLFRFFTSWGLRIIPKLFQRDMYRCLTGPNLSPPLKTAHYSPMLHNALLAVATAFSEDSAIKAPATRQLFADKAKSFLEAECELPKLSAMTALSILANYHSSTNHPTLGYIYFGISARMSQALGLGIDCSPWVEAGLITHAGMLDRNWALWATFCQDTKWSLYVGREFCTTSSVNSEAIPVPFVSPDLDPFLGCWPPKENEPPNHISGTFAATCSLMQIAREVADAVSNFSRLGIRQETNEFRIAQMDLKLSSWKNDLPAEIDITKSSPSVPQPHQLMLHMTYYWLIILLHRPFYRRRRSFEDLDGYTDHIKPCDRAAAAIMELAGTWRRNFSLRYVPITMIQVLSAAATIFVVAAVQAVSGPRIAHNALDSAEKSAANVVQYLREVGESFASATTVADILQNLIQEQVQARKARRSPGSSPSGSGNFVSMVPWTSPIDNPSMPGGPLNPISPPSWTDPVGPPLNVYAHVQPPMGYSNAQYSTLAGALETPLNYHQPFGDGLGDSLFLPAAVALPGMGVGSIVKGEAVVNGDPVMMFRSPEQAFYAYQMGVPAAHTSARQ